MYRVFWYFALYFMAFEQNDQKSCIKGTKCVEFGINMKEVSSILCKKHNFARLGGFEICLILPKEGPISMLPQGSNGSLKG